MSDKRLTMVRSLVATASVAAFAAAAAALYLRRRRQGKPCGILVRDRRRRASSRRRSTWDEEALAQHQKERGVEYGTMKVDHPDTPYLYYDGEKETVQEYIKGQAPKTVGIHDLQERLGVLHLAQEQGAAEAKPGAARQNERAHKSSAFEEKRRQHYKNERGK